MIKRLKNLFGGSGEKTHGYGCSECETSFSIPQQTPITCPDCGSADFVFPDQNIVINTHRCNDCSETFAFPEGAEVICPDCESTSARTVT